MKMAKKMDGMKTGKAVRTGRVGEEHDQPVDSDTPAAGRWKTVLEGINERFVDVLRLVVSLRLLSYLRKNDCRQLSLYPATRNKLQV